MAAPPKTSKLKGKRSRRLPSADCSPCPFLKRTIHLKVSEHPYLRRDVRFILWATKKPKWGCRGRCWKFYGEPDCDGAIWHVEGDTLALLHECVHLAHHLLRRRVFYTRPAMLRVYDDLGHNKISREEKLCHLVAALQFECLANKVLSEPRANRE
jgi:hypothetical protein